MPSTVIAISYFENFIKLLADEIIRQGDKIQIGDKVYKSAKIRIVIPRTLDADMKRQATIYFRKYILNHAQSQLFTVVIRFMSNPPLKVMLRMKQLLQTCQLS